MITTSIKTGNVYFTARRWNKKLTFMPASEPECRRREIAQKKGPKCFMILLANVIVEFITEVIVYA